MLRRTMKKEQHGIKSKKPPLLHVIEIDGESRFPTLYLTWGKELLLLQIRDDDDDSFRHLPLRKKKQYCMTVTGQSWIPLY